MHLSDCIPFRPTESSQACFDGAYVEQADMELPSHGVVFAREEYLDALDWRTINYDILPAAPDMTEEPQDAAEEETDSRVVGEPDIPVSGPVVVDLRQPHAVEPDLLVDDLEIVPNPPVVYHRPSPSPSTLSYATTPRDPGYKESIYFIKDTSGSKEQGSLKEVFTCHHKVESGPEVCGRDPADGIFTATVKTGHKKTNAKALLHMGNYHPEELSRGEFAVFKVEKVKAAAETRLVDQRKKARKEEEEE